MLRIYLLFIVVSFLGYSSNKDYVSQNCVIHKDIKPLWEKYVDSKDAEKVNLEKFTTHGKTLHPIDTILVKLMLAHSEIVKPSEKRNDNKIVRLLTQLRYHYISAYCNNTVFNCLQQPSLGFNKKLNRFQELLEKYLKGLQKPSVSITKMKKNLLAAIEADLKVVEKNLRKKGDCTKIDVTSNFGLNSTPDLVFKIGVIGCDSAQADKKNIGIGVVYCGAAYTEIAKFIAQLDTDYSHEYHDSLRADFIKVSIEGQADSYAVSSLSYPTTCCSNTFIPAGTEYYYEKDDPYFAKKRRILSNNCSIMKSNEELALGRANAAKCVIQETVGSRIKYDDHLFAVWNESSADKAGTYRKVIITVEAKNLLSYYTEYNKRTFQKNNKPRNAAEKALAQFSYRPC